MATMKLSEIGECASSLAEEVGAGISLAEAAGHLVKQQPRHAEFWMRTQQAINSGQPVSELLAEVWPRAMVSAVKAGEQSGTLDTVFARIEETVELQLQLRSTVMKLGYPLGIAFAAVGVFIGFMVFVIPMQARAFDTGVAGTSKNGVFALALWMEPIFKTYWLVGLIGLLVGGFALVAWLKSEEGRRTVLDFALDIPVLGTALTNMYMGLWCYNMALVANAGIDTATALTLTSTQLPDKLAAGVVAFERDLTVRHLTLSQAANQQTLPDDDPRQRWPYMVSNAFMVAESSGVLDNQLLKKAPALVKRGIKNMNTAVFWGNLCAMFLAAGMLMASVGAFYLNIFSIMSNIH